MAMSEEAKKKLREVQRTQRGVLLKDLGPGDLLVACDHWDEQGTNLGNWTQRDWIRGDRDYGLPSSHVALMSSFKEIPLSRHPQEWPDPTTEYLLPQACYLRYASLQQIQCLESRLPHRRILLPSPRHISRGVHCYDSKGRLCRPVLAFPLQVIQHLLTFFRIKDPTKYYRLVQDDLDAYDTY